MYTKDAEPKLKPFPLTDVHKGEIRIVDEYARVSKPFARYRVTVATNPEKAYTFVPPPMHPDTYIVAPSSDEAMNHVKKVLKLTEGDHELSVLTLPD